ncbi:hypothetical protein AALO_G00138990 [Alosa alosa]|uniref:Uncharacterized protein n=1 Tax=Alosa alosa TaxID=278164 RepID=A0AAV6GKZ4_9TELE|nr:hypothetical protein AALO_G00138990 [Alosa alosa]
MRRIPMLRRFIFLARRACKRKGVSRAVGFSSAFIHNHEKCPRRLKADSAAFSKEDSVEVLYSCCALERTSQLGD